MGSHKLGGDKPLPYEGTFIKPDKSGNYIPLPSREGLGGLSSGKRGLLRLAKTERMFTMTKGMLELENQEIATRSLP